MLTYVSSQSLAQNFTVYDDTHAPLFQRHLPVADIIKLDNLYSALQSDLTHKHRLYLYLAQHPSRSTQTYLKAKKYLLQLERSMTDLPLSSLLPSALPPIPSPVAAADTASAPLPTALQSQLNKLQQTIRSKDKTVQVSQPATRTSSACRQCAAASSPANFMFNKCKLHKPLAK